VVGTDAPTDEPAAGDHLYALPSIRQRIADNLALLLTALATFVFSTVLAPLQRLGNWWLVAAASFALAAVVAVLALLRRRSPPRRLQWLAGGLTACAVVTLVAGFVLRPGPVRYDRAATLVLVDTSQVMSERLPDAATKLDAALRSVRMHAVGAYEQLGLASYGVDDCGDRRPTACAWRSAQRGRAGWTARSPTCALVGGPTSRSRPDGCLESCSRSRARTGAC
jgi:hypothetical protein